MPKYLENTSLPYPTVDMLVMDLAGVFQDFSKSAGILSNIIGLLREQGLLERASLRHKQEMS